MGFQLLEYPEFPDDVVFLTLVKDINIDTLKEIKQGLVSGNAVYDYVFLNSLHIISIEQISQSIYRSLSNFRSDQAKSKTLNTEIILNLSPVNNISESLRRFGVNEDCPNVIVVKVLKKSNNEEYEKLNNTVIKLTNGKNADLNDAVLYDLVDLKKLKKVYKLNDVNYPPDSLQGFLTRLVIGACVMRGYS